MLYKALGWTVWKAARLYLRRRFAGTFTKRRVLLAGGAVVVAGVTAASLRASHDQ